MITTPKLSTVTLTVSFLLEFVSTTFYAVILTLTPFVPSAVMVKFGTSDMSKTFRLAEEAAEKASKIFPSPILLEFEKVYHPYLLM